VSRAAEDAMLGRLPMTGPVALDVRVIMDIPASKPPKWKAKALTGEILPTVKPDFDNLTKLLADAVNKIIWLDDKQVVRHTFDKRYGPQPMIVFTAREIIDPEIEDLLS
jgi:Holliday junction resolvase RusA-like endonuclease